MRRRWTSYFWPEQMACWLVALYLAPPTHQPLETEENSQFESLACLTFVCYSSTDVPHSRDMSAPAKLIFVFASLLKASMSCLSGVVPSILYTSSSSSSYSMPSSASLLPSPSRTLSPLNRRCLGVGCTPSSDTYAQDRWSKSLHCQSFAYAHLTKQGFYFILHVSDRLGWVNI